MKILGYILAVLVAGGLIGAIFGEEAAAMLGGAIGSAIGFFGLLWVFGLGCRLRRK